MSISIYAPFIDGAYYFYNILKLINKLITIKYRGKKIEINVYFVRIPLNISKLSYKNIYKFFKIQSKHKLVNKEDVKIGFYEGFIADGKVKVAFADSEIDFHIVDINLIYKVYVCISILALSICQWLRVSRFFWADVETLMALKSRGIKTGRAIGSSALRNSPNAYGNIKKCNLLIPIVGANYIVAILSRIKISSSENYCVPSERYFMHSLFVEVLRASGCSILDSTQNDSEFKIIGPYENFNSFNQVEYHPYSLLKLGIERASAYMETRIKDPEKALWYMFRGSNSCDEKILDALSKPIQLIKKRLYVIVFLHMFEDGQYAFGYDGFDDIFAWTTFTINQLLKNNNIEKIFIKKHPNMSYSKYPGDKIANETLVKLYSSNNKIVWLHESCGPYAFRVCPNVIGVTKHGSVAEEMAYLRIPSISSECSRWKDYFQFSKTWKNVDEYKKILKNLTLEESVHLSDSQVSSLFKYINIFHLGSKSIQQRQAWVDYANEIKNEKVTPLDFDRYETELRNLAITNDNFVKFLELYGQSLSKL